MLWTRKTERCTTWRGKWARDRERPHAKSTQTIDIQETKGEVKRIGDENQKGRKEKKEVECENSKPSKSAEQEKRRKKRARQSRIEPPDY